MKASTATSPSLFLFLMRLAWRCRLSVPLLLSGSVALLGHAWMLQVSVHTVPRIHERELAYYEEEEDLLEEEEDNEGSWETETSASWETIVEEVAYG